jgi:amino acid adenylation domain-containing protein
VLLECASLEELARESGRVVAEAIEHGGNYPFGRLVRECGLPGAGEHLMDVTFDWLTGQDLSGLRVFEEQRGAQAKNVLSVSSDGRVMMVETVLPPDELRHMEVLRGMWSAAMARRGGRTGAVSASVERVMQEEEWAGPVMSSMPKTLQQAMGRLRGGRGRRRAGVALLCVQKANDVVGLHMERSELLIELVYGVMESGGAFLPLDSQYSREVVEFRLRDSSAVMCIVDCWRNGGLSGRAAVGKQLGRSRESPLRLVTEIGAESTDLAYMFYTSGSTGVPKGVMIMQRNVTNLLEWISVCQFQVCQSDVFLLQYSISFDPFVEILLWHLVSHCEVLLIPDTYDRDVSYLNTRIQQVSVLDMTPSMFAVLNLDKSSLLRLAFLGGEPITQSCFSKTSARIWNGYGPTETTVFVSANPFVETRLTIGRPLVNVCFSLAKRELVVSGKCVGKGYKSLFFATRAVFCYDSQANDGCSKQYFTGDIGEFCLQTGDMVYRHRKDAQVKISGQRVELGAVENAILSCAGVQGCAVVVVESSAAMKSLAAVYVGTASVVQVQSELRRRGGLARHEMPQQVVRVDEIPLTRAGKADRRALREKIRAASTTTTDDMYRQQQQHQRQQQDEFVSPESRARSIVEEAFREVLGQQHKHSGKDLSFWELGGTSLMGMALDGVLQRKTGVKVGIGRLMRDGTVEAVAKIIAAEEQRDSGSGSGSVVSVHQHEDQRDYLSSPSPCMFWASASQAGLYVAWKMEQDPKNAYTVSQVFDVVAGRVDVGRVVAAVDELMQLHETLRTRFVEADGRVMQVVEGRAKSVESAVSSVVEVVDVADRDEGEMVARRAGQHAFDLQRGPMLRVVVVRVAGSKEDTSARSQPDMLVFVMPHICYDHGSERRLFGDFVKLYTGGREEARKLAPTNMREFAVWEQQMLAERGSRLEEFWRRHLEGAKLSRIPGTRAAPKGMMMMSEARVQSIRWSEQVGARVREWMRRGGWRQVSVLHATLAALIGRLTGDESVVLAIALSQRGFGGANENASANASLARSGSSVVGNGAVGYMMNVVWVRYAVGGALGRWASVADFVDDCQRRISEAFEHGDYPLALVWRAAGFGELGGEEVTVALDVVPEFPRDETGDVLRESGIEVPQLPPNMIQFSGELEGQTLGLAVNARASNFCDGLSAHGLLSMWSRFLLSWSTESQLSSDSLFLSHSLWFSEQEVSWKRRYHEIVLRRLQCNNIQSDSVSVSFRLVPNEMVGVIGRRSIQTLLLEYTLLANAAGFVPVDADFPLHSVLYRFFDMQVQVCACASEYFRVLASHLQLVSLELSLSYQHQVRPLAAGRSVAYGLHTSGSTGVPKGVLVSRENLSFYLSSLDCTPFQWTSNDAIMLSTSISFDIAMTQRFWPSVSGSGRVVVLEHGLERDPLQMIGCIIKSSVSVLFVTPSVLDGLVSFDRGNNLSSTIALCMVIGEAFPFSLRNRIDPKLNLWNVYGPTEATIAISSSDLSRESSRKEGVNVPIGRPFPNSRVFCTSWGELLLFGPQVGLCYKNKAQQTRERFVYDSWSNDGKSKMYRSGDYGRLLDCGELEYVGRADDQVKVLGHRIELGSIECAIRTCKGVTSCAVSFVNNAIVAFVQGMFEEGALSRELLSILPSYEMPKTVFKVDHLPLTSAGKVDRAKLKEMVSKLPRNSPPLSVSFSNRHDSGIESLFREHFGASDHLKSMWELGATSITALQFDEAMFRNFGKRVGLPKMMRDGTLEGLIAWLGMESAGKESRVKGDHLPSSSTKRFASSVFCRATAGQEGLYVIWRTDPLATNYNMLTTVPCPTSDGSAIERGLHSVTAMHAALRTRRVSEFNGTVLLEMRGAPAKTCLDVANVDSEADAKLLEWMEGLSSSWDLERGDGLMRATAVLWRGAGQTEATAAALMLVMHHIIGDEWSMQVVEQDLHRAWTQNEAPHVDSIRANSTLEMWDVAELEAQLLQERGDEMRTWWRRHLEGARVTRVPQKSATFAAGARRSKSVIREIPEGPRKRVQEAGRRAGVSVFAVWQGLFAWWQWRAFGSSQEQEQEEEEGEQQQQQKLGIGSSSTRGPSVLVVGPYGRRDDERVHRTVGYLVNMVVYRYGASVLLECASLEELARESGRVVAEAIEHGGNYPFGRLVRECGLPGAGEHLMDVTFDWLTGQDLSGLRVFEEQRGAQAKNVLSVSSDGRVMMVETVLPPDELRHMEVLRGMWSAAMARRGGRTGAVSASVERVMQEEEWAGPVMSSMPKTLQQAMGRLRGGRGRRRAGVALLCVQKANDVVGLHMERSELLIELVYGVMESGGAFLPLDSQYSREVVEFRLRDSSAVMCIVDCWRNGGLSGRAAVGKQLGRSRESPLRLVTEIGAESTDLAYMFYTSGSTGVPKGVMIMQRNVTNLLEWIHHVPFQMSTRDVFLWQSSISFDMLVMDLLWPFVSQGSVAVFPENSVLDTSSFVRALPVCSVFFFVPAQLAMICEAFQSCSRIALVMTAGEALSFELVSRLRRAYKSCEAWNVYGPTETTVDVSFLLVPKDCPSSGVVSIGRAFENLRLKVRSDSSLLLCGKSVGAGYLNRPEKSRSAFIYDHDFNDGEGRMYVSGDLASFADDGCVNYHGRSDDQVKINGQRVELAAVESALMSHSAISQCCAVVIPDGTGVSKQLVAFVCPSSVSVASIRLHLQNRLARYEQPHLIIPRDTLPLSSAGKVNRGQLGQLANASCEEQTVVEDAKSSISVLDTVMLAFDEVLGVSGRENKSPSSFWELGGTSLMGMALDGVLQRKTGVKVGIGRLMRDGTVEGIAKFIQEHEAQISLSQRPERLIPATQARCSPAQPSFCRATAGQEGLYVIWRTDPLATNYNMLTTVPCPTSDGSAIERGLHSVTAMHAALRTRRVSEFNGTVLLEMRGAPAKTCLDVANVDSEADAKLLEWMEGLSSSWDLERGDGLMRATAVLWRGAGQTEATAAALMLVMHHIIGDEWSMQVVEQDLHRAWTQNEAPHVDSIRANSTLEMWDVAELEAQLLQERGDEMRTWWRRHLEGARVTRVPQKSATFAAGARRSKSVIREIPEGPRKRVQEAGRRAGVSVFAVWQGLFAWWQWRAFGSSQEQEQEEEEGEQQQQQKLGIGSSSTRGPSVLVVGPYGRRDDERVHRTVGYLVNMVVYRYGASVLLECASLEELARESGRVVAEAIEHGGNYPFGRLVRECGLPGAGEHLMDVTFDWLTGQDLSGLRVFEEQRGAQAKNVLSVSSDGRVMMVETVLPPDELRHMEVLRGMWSAAMARRGGRTGAVSASVERVMQEEEWAGPVMSSMPKTLQQAMGRLRGGRGRRRAGVALLCVQKANDVVGLHMERSELLIELVYGVMESGGAFLPLDSQYSREVVEFRLRDSGAAICMIMPQAMLSLAWPCCIASLLCDRISSCVCRSASSDVAYVMHTSGSTGAPKGAKVLQRNVTNLLDWSAVGEHLQLCHEDAFVWQSSISFDMLILDLLWPRMADCTVLCVRDGVERDTRDMAQFDAATESVRAVRRAVALERSGLGRAAVV